MRILAIVIVVASSLWGGYWFAGSSALEKGLNSWLTNVQSQSGPVKFTYASAKTQGFPNRFDTTIRDISVLDQVKNIGWAADTVRIFALSYKPNHIIMELPPAHQLTTPAGKFDITNDELRGSVVFKAETALGLDHSAFVISNLHASTPPLDFSIQDANFATRQTKSIPLAHDVFFTASNVAFPHDLIAQFDTSNQMSDVIEKLLIDMSVTLDKPIDRFLPQGTPAKITHLTIRNSSLEWGKISISSKGDLQIDAKGTPSGILGITLTNWRIAFGLAVDSGTVDPNFAVAMESVLKSMADASGDPETIDVALEFKNGQMALGPIPLGPAPRF